MLGSLSNTVPCYVGGSPICEPEHRASTLHVQAALEGLEALRESCAGTAVCLFTGLHPAQTVFAGSGGWLIYLDLVNAWAVGT